jgi:hypothetical protein
MARRSRFTNDLARQASQMKASETLGDGLQGQARAKTSVRY